MQDKLGSTDFSNWRQVVKPYETPHTKKGLWQVFNTVIPYYILWVLMWKSLSVSYGLTLLLSVIAGLFLIRIFVLFHDCCHQCFVPSRRLNEIIGQILGVIVFTPLHYWRHGHAVHHATSGDLDRRGIGDVWTATVEEYKQMSPRRKFMYRLYRNPVLLFGLAPAFKFLIHHRFVDRADSRLQHRRSVYWTNLGIIVYIALLSWLFGFRNFWLIQVPVMTIGGAVGVWLFYVQHQFEDSYWDRHESWDFLTAALLGSSYYQLPGILHWFTANIGFHHIHHLSPKIPNYHLARCHFENAMFREIEGVTIRKSLKSLRYRLWDEDARIYTGFHAARSRAE